MVFAGLTQRVIAGFIDAFLLGSAIMALVVWMPRDFLNHALQNTLVLTVAVVWLAVILFFVFQRHFVSGANEGGVKG